MQRSYLPISCWCLMRSAKRLRWSRAKGRGWRHWSIARNSDGCARPPIAVWLRRCLTPFGWCVALSNRRSRCSVFAGRLGPLRPTWWPVVGRPDQAAAKLLAYQDPVTFGQLIDRLVAASADYLVEQLSTSTQAVQDFDTWSSALSPEEFEHWCIDPVRGSSRKWRADPRCEDHSFPTWRRHVASAFADRVAVTFHQSRLDS